MAGMNAGTKTIGFMDKFNASYAQKHPISNTIAAGIIGPIKGIATVSFGLLASPFLNSASRASILGSGWDVCTSCGSNVIGTVNTVYKAAEILDQRQLPYLNQLLDSWSSGFAVATKCAVEVETQTACRAFNYAGSIVNTLSNNYVLVGAATVGLVAYFTYNKMNTYKAKECQTEENLKNELTERYEKIAARLTSLESNSEIQKCATKILERRFEINSELKSLQLPSLSWKVIKQITKPVFDAAIKQKQNS